MPKYNQIIFDGSNAAHRISSAVPPLNNAKGDRVEVIYGLLKLISSVSRLNSAGRCVIAFDGIGARQIRQNIDPVYKDHRGKGGTEEDKARIAGMHHQVEVLWDMFGRHLPITWVISTTYEADDIMAMAAAEASTHGETSLIVSGDKDMLQLVSPTVTVYSPNRNTYCRIDNFQEYTDGFPTPESFLYGKVLIGEPPTGDNIPGIRGCGEVYAKRFLASHKWNLAELLSNPNEDLKKTKVGQAIICADGRDRIAKNYKLMSLRGHKRMKIDKVEIRKGKMDKRQLQLNMARMQFVSILASFNQFINPFMTFGG